MTPATFSKQYPTLCSAERLEMLGTMTDSDLVECAVGYSPEWEMMPGYPTHMRYMSLVAALAARLTCLQARFDALMAHERAPGA